MKARFYDKNVLTAKVKEKIRLSKTNRKQMVIGQTQLSPEEAKKKAQDQFFFSLIVIFLLL